MDKNKESLKLSNEESNRITKESLQEALVLLMNEKRFEKISITELVHRAGVSRTSFYRNYTTKEQILADAAKQLKDDLQQVFYDGEYIGNRYNWYLTLLTMIKENSAIIKLILDGDIIKYIGLDGLSVFSKIFDTKSPDQYYLLKSYEGAMLYTCFAWFSGGMKESVEYMADFYSREFDDIFERIPINKNENRDN